MAGRGDHGAVPAAHRKKRLARLVRFHLFLKGDRNLGQAPEEWALSNLMQEFGGSLTGGGLLDEPLPVLLDIFELRRYAQALDLVTHETDTQPAPEWAAEQVYACLFVLREDTPGDSFDVDAAVEQWMTKRDQKRAAAKG